ncbi:hypothetical protein ACFWHT_08795 [Microbacterium sp. NPDC058342]|uniref:hypothetical protein n=1 Tax=Microbacterium sp. NPDC058342 TaxID=3346454 RepID=UPI0036513106
MKRRAVWAVIAAVGIFAVFFASVWFWGSWWRFPGMPSAEEWSALFGATALIALGFAWYQIRQVDQSNKALIASNEHSQHVNAEAVRPRVQVALRADRTVLKERGGPVKGTLYVAVRNIGVSPATDVKLRVTPPFTSLETFFKPGMMGQHFEEVNRVFNGETAFPTLNPGNSYIWFLGRVPELFEEAAGVPRRWAVEAEYTGTVSDKPFHDTFILDLDVEKRIELPVDPLIRIGKDIQVVGEKLERIRSATPRTFNLGEETLATLRRPQSAFRPRLRLPQRRFRGRIDP